MNSDQLDEFWQSPANRPDGDAGRRLADHFVATLRRRRRFQAWWLGWMFFAMTAISVLALVQVRAADPFAGQWTLLPLLAVPWLAAFWFLRAFFRDAGPVAAGIPVRATLLAARDANRAARRRLTLVAALLVTMIPVSAVAVWQLHAAGKAPGYQAWSMAIVFAMALAGGLTGVALRYFRRLVPEQRTIEDRLRELEGPSGA